MGTFLFDVDSQTLKLLLTVAAWKCWVALKSSACIKVYYVWHSPPCVVCELLHNYMMQFSFLMKIQKLRWLLSGQRAGTPGRRNDSCSKQNWKSQHKVSFHYSEQHVILNLQFFSLKFLFNIFGSWLALVGKLKKAKLWIRGDYWTFFQQWYHKERLSFAIRHAFSSHPFTNWLCNMILLA